MISLNIFYFVYCYLLLCLCEVAKTDISMDPQNQNMQLEQPKDPLKSKNIKDLMGGNLQCASNEIFIVNKGCVDREAYLERLFINTWNDDTMASAKRKAGLRETVQCKNDEIMKAFGCAPKNGRVRTDESKRPTIVHSQLYDSKVFKSGDAIPNKHGRKDGLRHTEGASNIGRQRNHMAHNIRGTTRNIDIHENSKSKSHVGHNRPRSYVFMPGRKLQSQRTCRPYEVLARSGRCIRKLGKSGLYKHTDHKYGIQQRHRHEAFKNIESN
ncbi:uncharacterized protein LOC117575104 [Drosophila albomicans]|uniref:Uncharacterized protein LOC117575104 n=1 Tax=Drosophila albomicans TaxID=7291 RepID=A0A6P8ZDR2_DROAB|nr:uncharacterized protein LOC117575104 [Drosophila albomicans]